MHPYQDAPQVPIYERPQQGLKQGLEQGAKLMPKTTQRLNKKIIPDLRPDNKSGHRRYADGDRLYLSVDINERGITTRSWEFIYPSPVHTDKKGKPRIRTMGLGAWPQVSEVEARNYARQQNAVLREGRDPLDERERLKAVRVAAAVAQNVLTLRQFAL